MSNPEGIPELVEEKARVLGTPGHIRMGRIGLKPGEHTQQLAEINHLLTEAETAIREQYELPHHTSSFDAVQTPGGITVLFSWSAGPRFADIAEKLSDDERFMVTIGDETFDTRKGMTLGVYWAVRKRRAHGDLHTAVDIFDRDILVDTGRGNGGEKSWRRHSMAAATMLTGQEDTSYGVPVIFRDETIEVHDPESLKWLVPGHERQDRTLLAFRPGVVLGYAMFPDALPKP